MKTKFRALRGEKEWLDILPAPAANVALDLSGYPSQFSPQAGWDMGPRRNDEHLVYFVVKGCCSAVLDGKRIRPAAGSLCWICPGTPFRFFLASRDPSPVIYRFRFKVEAGRQSLRPAWSHQFLPEAWSILDTVKQLILEVERPGKFHSWKVRNLISLLSSFVFEQSPERRGIGTFLNDRQRSEIAASLLNDPAIRKSPADLARLLGFSAAYFTRIFRRSYGMAPRAWLLRQRLTYAAMLLRESNSRVSEIAEKLGYREVYLFSRQFRHLFGASPKQWRKGTSRDTPPVGP